MYRGTLFRLYTRSSVLFAGPGTKYATALNTWDKGYLIVVGDTRIFPGDREREEP
jgi:hypothetical protein